jgi:hypothetical protein
MLDAFVMQLHKMQPSLFYETNFIAMFPSYLKMYLYAHVLWFLYRNDSVSIFTGGPVPPSTTGFRLPRGLLRWLSHLAPYVEEGAGGVVRYNMSAMPATGVRKRLAVGTPVETDIGLGNYEVASYSLNTSFQELEKNTTAITSLDLPTFWNTFGADISSKLQGAELNCVAMPEECKEAPDASAWAHPYDNGQGGVLTSSARQISCVFAKWHPETAMLFLDWNTTYQIQPSGVIMTIPRPSGVYGIDVSWNSVSIGDSARILRENYAFIAHYCDDDLGRPINEITWMGEKLNTLNIGSIPIQRIYRNFIHGLVFDALSGVSPGSDFTVTPDAGFLASSLMVVNAVEYRRIQQANPRYEIQILQNGQTGGPSDAPIPMSVLGARLPLLEAQLANEIGAVVYRGQLWCPLAEVLGKRWHDQIRLGDTDNPTSFFGQPFAGAQFVSTGSFQLNNATTLNTTWLTNYGALSGAIWTPMATFDTIMGKFLTSLGHGVGYGRNELLWPVSNSPRGGAAMLAKIDLSGNQTTGSMFINSAQANYTIFPISGIGSTVTLSPADHALAVLGVFSRAPTTTFGQTVRNLRNSKFYQELPSSFVYPSWVTEIITATVNTGGSATILLAEAIKERHQQGDEMSLFSGIDDVDACLWDALKGVLHTVARTLEPVVPFVAGSLCAPAGPAAAAGCSAAADIINQRLIDMSTTKTNRQSVSRQEARRKMEKEAHMMDKPSTVGEPVLYGPGKHVAAAVAGGLAEAADALRARREKQIYKQVAKKKKKKEKKKVIKKAQKKAAKASGMKAPRPKLDAA